MKPLHQWRPGVVVGVGAVAGAMAALGLSLLLLAVRRAARSGRRV